VLFGLPMEFTLKTLGTLCSSGAVGTFVRAAANMRCGDLLPPLKEPGFVLHAYVRAKRHQGVVAEWSACPSVNLALRVLFSDPLHFSFFLRGHVIEVRRRTLGSNVFSVAEWLALLRCQ